ncbi:hypothetical protein ACFV2X_42880 [Streptomyces sp. NPDC059679]|uniref:hypothetical protein n=1 Tax=Streptomyces sp. NPDC059679 TaxID=3346903 RepID=UPI00369C4DAD
MLAAASRCAGPEDRHWYVLTDHQQWSSSPLNLPHAPEAWYQLGAAGGWQALVADTSHPVAHDVVSARCEGHGGLTAAWCSLPFSVPVLCTAATGQAVHALQTAVSAAAADGLPLQRMVLAVVAVSEGRIPAPVRAAITMLQDRVSSVVMVPFDPHIRAHGMTQVARLKPRTLGAGTQLAHRILDSLHSMWGDPLPPAPVPALAPSTD